MSEVLNNPKAVSWGAVAGVVGLFIAQITGVSHDLSGNPTAGEAQLGDQLREHDNRIQRNWNQINEDRADYNRRFTEIQNRIAAVERTSDRVVDRMDGLRVAMDAITASSSDLSKQVRELAQIVAVMDNRVLTMSRDIDQRRPADGR